LEEKAPEVDIAKLRKSMQSYLLAIHDSLAKGLEDWHENMLALENLPKKVPSEYLTLWETYVERELSVMGIQHGTGPFLDHKITLVQQWTEDYIAFLENS
jgi:hypothetical protein